MTGILLVSSLNRVKVCLRDDFEGKDGLLVKFIKILSTSCCEVIFKNPIHGLSLKCLLLVLNSEDSNLFGNRITIDTEVSLFVTLNLISRLSFKTIYINSPLVADYREALNYISKGDYLDRSIKNKTIHFKSNYNVNALLKLRFVLDYLPQLDLDSYPYGSFILYIKVLNGKTYTVSADVYDTLEPIRTYLANKLNVEVGSFRLIFAGKEIFDKKAIRSYGIQTKTTLHLVFKNKIFDKHI